MTIGALLGMAAHIEGKGAAVLDMTGLAQKGGSVYSHIRLAPTPEDIHAVRIAAGDARVVIGCDMIVAASDEAIAKMQTGHTRAVINADVAPTGGFTKDPDLQVPTRDMADSIREACGAGSVDFIDASDLATALMGDSIATNLFMVGFAWQKGLIPIGQAAIMQAIDLNGAAVESNKKAFEWGRRAAVDVASVERAATPPEAKPESQRMSQSLEETVSRRRKFLVDYQDEAYAKRYRTSSRVRAREQARHGIDALTSVVARYLFKLMAYKDEYEVARLFTQTDFVRRSRASSRATTPSTCTSRRRSGRKWTRPRASRASAYGPWMLSAMRVLAKMKFLRGSALDVFGYAKERRTERQLISDYEKTVGELLEKLEAKRIDSPPRSPPSRVHPRLRPREGPPPRRRQVARSQLLDQWRNPGLAAAKRIPIKAAA